MPLDGQVLTCAVTAARPAAQEEAVRLDGQVLTCAVTAARPGAQEEAVPLDGQGLTCTVTGARPAAQEEAVPLDGQVASMRATVLYNGALQALMLGRPVTAMLCFQVRPPERTGLCGSYRCSCVAMPRSRSAPLAHAPR